MTYYIVFAYDEGLEPFPWHFLKLLERHFSHGELANIFKTVNDILDGDWIANS